MLRVRLKLRMGRAPPRGLPSSVAKPCVRSLHIEQQQQEEEEEGVGEDALVHFVRTRKNLLVITGAGVSTESGLPDYRGPQGSYAKGHKPTLYRDFVSSPTLRCAPLLASF